VAAEFIDYLSTKYTEWYNSPERDEESIFKVNLSLGVTKPLIPSYVTRGISRLETDAMKESITKCFKKEGLLDEARLQSTYERALRLLGNAAVAIPDEIEEEEDLGAIEDEDLGAR